MVGLPPGPAPTRGLVRDHHHFHLVCPEGNADLPGGQHVWVVIVEALKRGNRRAVGEEVLDVVRTNPLWYEAEQVVPTWNYAAVHVYGQVQIIEDEGALLDIVQETVRVYEQAMTQPWSVDSSGTFVKRLLAQIVGFRIEVERIEGKWKLNQNHPVERRKKVVRALRARGDEHAQAVAAMMQAMLPAEG